MLRHNVKCNGWNEIIVSFRVFVEFLFEKLDVWRSYLFFVHTSLFAVPVSLRGASLNVFCYCFDVGNAWSISHTYLHASLWVNLMRFRSVCVTFCKSQPVTFRRIHSCCLLPRFSETRKTREDSIQRKQQPSTDLCYTAVIGFRNLFCYLIKNRAHNFRKKNSRRVFCKRTYATKCASARQ